MPEVSPRSIHLDENRLIGTMISGKPSSKAFLIALLTLLSMTFVSFLFWFGPKEISQLLPAEHETIFIHGQLWRIFSAIFVHADLEHFLSNMILLCFFSYLIFGYFGFGIFPILGLFLAGVTNAVAAATYPVGVELIGASGLVYLLGAFWLTTYALIQRQYPILNRLMRITGLTFVIFVPSTFVPNVSYRTHAIGFFIGIFMGLIYFWQNIKKIRSFEIYKLIPTEVDQEIVDEPSAVNEQDLRH